MCGISGIYDRTGKPVDKDLLERMTSTSNIGARMVTDISLMGQSAWDISD